MKKILLVIAVFAVAKLNAQIVNAGFENWGNYTSNFAGFTGVVAPDTFTYSDPVGWTSANAVTGDTALGGLILVTQSDTAHSGTSSIQLTTDTLKTIYIAALNASRQLAVPGLVLSGVFPVSALTSNIVSVTGGSINPGKVPGAGQPFTQRLAAFSGYYQYAPVFNTFTNASDTCVLWATLRKGSTIIADAEFKAGASTNGTWAQFSAPFVYHSCDAPDTLVVLLSSSLPVFSSVLSGNTDLTPGSVLLVDDLTYDTLAAGTNFVFAQNDAYTVNRGIADTLDVLANDTSCNSSALTVTITTAPANGTASVLSNGKIVYTANAAFMGRDSLYYKDTDPNNVASSAWAKFDVTYGVGISEANEVSVKVYPVPASDALHIRFDNKGRTTARIYDVVGNLVSIATFIQNDNTIDLSNFANGVYSVQLLDENNALIARTQFVVNK